MDKAKISWNSFIASLGLEPRECTVVRGASGLDHNVLALGVDDKNKRLLLISEDPNPRIAALTQIDIKMTLPDTSVLVARPIILDLGVIARQIASLSGFSSIKFEDIKAWSKAFSALSEDERKLIINS